MKIQTEHFEVLVTILGRVDAVFYPYRFASNEAANSARVLGAILSRRQGYRTVGIEFVGGGDVASRKNLMQSLEELQQAGAIRICSPRGRRHGVWLTPAGDAFTRGLAPVNRVDESYRWVKRILTAAATETNCGFAWEGDVLGKKNPTDRDLEDLADFMLPLLANEICDSYSDAAGRIGYAVVNPLPRRPRAPRALPEYTSELGQAYIDAFEAGIAARERWCDERVLGIPSSAGMWGGEP